MMWWFFIARTPDENTQARSDWDEQRRFGEVDTYAGPRPAARSLTRFARPNPVS
jgi:quercetin 2,3-dioxygenase